MSFILSKTKIVRMVLIEIKQISAYINVRNAVIFIPMFMLDNLIYFLWMMY